MRRRFSILAAAALLFALGCDEERPLAIERDMAAGFDPLRFLPGVEPEGALPEGKLRFSLSPFYTQSQSQQLTERMRIWLEDKTALPTEAHVAASYEEAYNGLVQGDVDVAQLPPYACVRALARDGDVELLVTAIAQGTSTYASYLVVRADDDIETINDAKGRRLGLTDPWSASGFLYPWAWLRRHGLDPEKDFSVVLIGQHDEALAALLDGRVDVAAVSSDTLVSKGVLGIAGPVRIIAKAGRIPYDCVAVRRALGPRVAWHIKNAFLRLSILTPEGRAVLRDYNLVNGFIPLPRGHYDGVRALDEEYGAEVAKAAAALSPPPQAGPAQGAAPKKRAPP